MKYRTSKRAERPWWRRLKRAWDRWVEDLTRNEFEGLPRTLDDFNAGRHGR